MTFQTLTQKERITQTGLFILLGYCLSETFLQLSNSFYHFALSRLIDSEYLKMAAFPILAIILFMSLPTKLIKKQKTSYYFLLGFPLSFLIALLYGFIIQPPILNKENLFWYAVFVPIGEEILFRGWLMNLAYRLFPDKYYTLTNPLPSAVVLSSFAFSVWHWQNHLASPVLIVAFQILYTFFTGLWLGNLRIHTRNLLFPILAHSLLNLSLARF